MHRNDPAREVSCTLTPEREADRPEEVWSLLVARYAGFEEHDDGVAIRFEGTDEALLAVAEFTSHELACCSFADYEITVSPPYDETVLTVTGPEGTRTMFREGLVDRLEAEAP